MRVRRNSVKVKVLRILATQGPQRVDELAVMARGTSRNYRSFYYLVDRYQRFGLVRKLYGEGSHLRVRITERGRDRLRWLQR